MSWSELVQHARFPEKDTTITDTSLEVPIGRFDCWLYTLNIRDDQGRPLERRFFFAKELPGPPIHAETLAEGRKILRTTLIERGPEKKQ